MEGYAAGDCFYGREIDADDEGVGGHDFGGDLAPGTGRSAEVDEDFGFLEEVVFLVESVTAFVRRVWEW